MIHTLENDTLRVQIDDHGAQLRSIRKADCEYLWQGDPTYWKGQAPILFPICGRLTEGRYTWRGISYEMERHGFARNAEFRVAEASPDRLSLVLESSSATKAAYPCDFRLEIRYLLEGAELRSEIFVRNTGADILPFAFGAHPGFRVPLEESTAFEDWSLVFDRPCSPDRYLLTADGYQTGRMAPLPLEGGTTLPLRHALFDDAVFLTRVTPSVALRSPKSARFARVKFPSMPILGFWQPEKTDAPFVCIEPWCGLPAFAGEVDDFDRKTDFFRLGPGEEKFLTYTIEIG